MKTKPQIIASILCLLMVAFCVVGLTACGEEPECSHEWGEWSVTTNATCTEAGVKECKCETCGETKTSAVEALGHDWSEATCSAPKTCKNCSATEGSVLAHTYTVEAVKAEALKSEATETSAAVYYKSCACGAISTNDADTFTYGETAGHVHNFTLETVGADTAKDAATCESAAVYYKSCSCGAISKNDADTFTSGSALGHKDEDTDHVCDNNCGKIDVGAHSDANTDDDHFCDYGCGAAIESCSDADNDGDHACDVCGKADVSSHNYGNAACGTFATCSECGATTGTVLEHKDDNHDHICDNGCGKNDIGAHSDSNTDNDHVCDYGCNAAFEGCYDAETDDDHACDVCGKADVTPHAYAENKALATKATCDTAATKTYECNCGDSYTENDGDSLGHNITGVKPTEKLVSGCEYILVYKCQNPDCGKDVTGETVYSHNYIASISTPATCSAAGEKTFKCSICGDESKQPERIPANDTGHNWSTGDVENGVRTDTCSICSATKTVMVSNSNSASSNASNLANTDVQLKVDDSTNANIQLGQGVADAIGNKDITISAGVVDENTLKDMGVSNEQLGQIGANTVYDFNIKDGNGTPVSDFGKNNYVTITLPYTLAEGEDIDSIAVWFISDTCQVENCDKGENCVDAHKLVSIEATYNNGFVTFQTNHFSIYTVTRLTPAERCELYGHGYVCQHVEGSCTKDSYDLYVCVRCHDKYIDEDTRVVGDGHDYTVDTHAATCTENGYILYDCKDCDYSYKAKLNATGHTWSVVDSDEASCVADGYTKYGCDNCDEEYTVKYAKLSHVYTNTVVPATCTVGGYTLHDCDNCDYSYTDDYVDAIGHSYGDGIWSWESNGNKAILTLVCVNDETHVLTQRASIDKVVTKGECSNYVIRTHTATVEIGGKVYTDVMVIRQGNPNHTFSSDWTKDENKHWHECVCGAETDVAEHTFENETVTKKPTCAEAGESTAYCVCGETKVTIIPKTGEHDYVDGVCTGCGEEQVDAYYVNLINSWKNINGFAVKLENLSYEVKQIDPDLLDALKVIGSIKQIDIAELALYMEDGELGGAAIGEIVIFNGPISDANAVYKFKAVIHEGYVYIKVEHGKDVADKAINIKISVDSMIESMLDEMGIVDETAYVLDFIGDTLLPAADTLIKLNSKEVDAILEDLFNTIFTFERKADDGSYVATLDYAKLYALNENLATKSVAEVIDIYFGEGSFDSIVTFVNEILDLEVSKIPEYLDEKGLDSDDLIEKINALAAQTGAPDGYDISDMLNSEELSGVTLGMLMFGVEDRSYADYVNEVVSELRTTSLYTMIEPDSVEDIRDGVKFILDMLAESVSVTFTTDADGMLSSVVINADKFTYSDEETEMVLNLDLEIVINEKIDVTWTDIIESIEEELVMPKDDMLDDGIQTEYGSIWGGYVVYKGQEYQYRNGIRIYASKTLYDKLAYVIFRPDCNGWTEFEACYAEEDYEFTLAPIIVDGEPVMILIDEYSREVVELVTTDTVVTVVYEDGSTKSIDMTPFIDIEDPAAAYTALYFEIFEDPEGSVSAFGDYLNYYYNAETKEYSDETHHDYEYEYNLNGNTCEDGCTVITDCKDCDYHDEQTRYWCDTESREIDLSELGLCGGYIYEEYCSVCKNVRHSSYNEGCKWEYIEQTEDGYEKYLCRRCGAVKLLYTHKGEKDENCICECTEIRRYIVNGEAVYSYERTYISASHNYQYEYSLNGDSCEDGVLETVYCPDCEWSESYEIFGHRYDYRELDLSEYGLCGGIIEEQYCPICDKVLYSNVYKVKCRWGHVGQTEDGYDKYECRNCGAVKLEHNVYGEKDENCQYEGTKILVFIVNGEEVYRDEHTYTYEGHDYRYNFELNGDSCTDGYTVIETCENCSYYWEDIRYDHEVRLTEIIDLSEHGACHGEFERYSCACGQEGWNNFNGCADNWTSNEYYDDDGRLIHVTVRTCSKCGLRYTRSYYTVKNQENCTMTYYYTVVINIGDNLIANVEYTEVREAHDYEITGTLMGGVGSSCEDGVVITEKCKYCDYEYSYETYYHETFEKGHIDLSELGSVCGGYATVYGCACGENGSLSLDHSLCELNSEWCELWIENAITESQMTPYGWWQGFGYSSYIYTCAVTDPADAACAYKIRYASYWLKDADSCMAYRYETWQFGYNEETGAYEYQVTFKTGDYSDYHNYVYNSTDGQERYDCPDCGSYVCLNSYDYAGTFGENGKKVVVTSGDANGETYRREYAYVYYKKHNFEIYEYVMEGNSWYRHDYSYSFENGCLRTIVYTNSDGENWTDTEDYCVYHRYITVKEPTCSQDGLECRECLICGTQSETYTVSAHDHNWVQVTENWYYCFTCGLENANGVSGDIIMEDLTEAYGNGENYVVGYYALNNVEFTTYVSLILADGTEVAIWEGIEFTTIDGIRAYAFSKAAVDAWAAENGYTDYDVRFSFVPIGSDGSFDYGITFTETIEIDTIIDDVSFTDYIGADETKSYTITPTEDGVWTFTSFANNDTYGYLYDAEGKCLTFDDDSGHDNNFMITYELKAGETYIIKVRWFNSEQAGNVALFFDYGTK